MSINEELFNQHCAATKEEFDKWNDEQKDEMKIIVRSPFTTELPKAKFGDILKKPYKGKNGQPDGTNVYEPIKGLDSQGTEVSWKVQLPTAVAPRGYTLIKHEKGEMKAIPLALDMGNPDHRLFYDEYQAKMTNEAYHHVMMNPSVYGAGFGSMKPIKEFTPAVIASPTYITNRIMIDMVMAKLIRNYAIKKVEVEGSPIKNMFLTPLDYKDPEKPNEPPAQMRISYKYKPGVPAIPIKLDELWDLCEGIKKDENGMIISKKPTGFQCSGEISVNRFNIGIKLNCKATCTALTIYSFFESKFKDSQEVKHTYVDENITLKNMNDAMSDYIIDMLNGLSSSNNNVNPKTDIPSGDSFNPSGIDLSDKSPNMTPSTPGFLETANAIQSTNAVAQSVATSSAPIATATVISSNDEKLPGTSSPSESFSPMNQQGGSSMLPPSFGVASGMPPSFNTGVNQSFGMPPPSSNGMPPPFNTGMNQSFGMPPPSAPLMSGDRMNQFNNSMIPTQGGI